MPIPAARAITIEIVTSTQLTFRPATLADIQTCANRLPVCKNWPEEELGTEVARRIGCGSCTVRLIANREYDPEFRRTGPFAL